MLHGPPSQGYSTDGLNDKFTGDFFQYCDRFCISLEQKYASYACFLRYHSANRLHGSDALHKCYWPWNYSSYAHFASRSTPHRQKVSLDQAQKPSRSLPNKPRQSTVWSRLRWLSNHVTKVLWNMPYFSARQVGALQSVQQLCARIRSSLCMAWHLHWKTELPSFYSILSSS